MPFKKVDAEAELNKALEEHPELREEVEKLDEEYNRKKEGIAIVKLNTKTLNEQIKELSAILNEFGEELKKFDMDFNQLASELETNMKLADNVQSKEKKNKKGKKIKCWEKNKFYQ